MDSYQERWALCIVPILVIYAFVEIGRGWRFLYYGEPSLSPNQRMYVGLVRLLKGAEAGDLAYEFSMGKRGEMAFGAWASIIGGVITLIVCIVLVLTN